MNNKNYVRFSNEQIASLGATNEGLEVILNNCNGLVYKIAKKTYMEGYELEEKANICRMGLVKAVRQFDLEKANAAGGDFYTFANKVVTSFIYQEASKLKAGKRGYNKEDGTSTKVYSLEYTRDTEGQDAEINYIEDETADTYKAATEDKWSWMLKFMTEKEYEYIYLYYREEYTMEEIANKYGVSKAMVNKTLKKAINKMKDRYTPEKLAEMLELR